jgi:pilus assembly protein CpaF
MVHLGRGVDGSRRVSEIAAVASNRRERFRLQSVMRFAAEPIGPDRVLRGAYRHYPVPKNLATRLFDVGESVPPAFGVGDDESLLREIT